MINKRTRAARAAAVHSLLHTAGEKEDFGVLAAQLYNAGGIGLAQLYHLCRGKNLLHKRYMRRLCKP